MNMQPNPKTLVVLAGGTIEGRYNPEEGTPYTVPQPTSVEDSAIPLLLEKLGAKDVDYLKLGMADSKLMALSDIDATLHHAIAEGYEKIVIVQGTDTMPLHAQYLKRQIAEWVEQAPELAKKKFVFTGAMTPLRDKHGNFRDESISDGWGNMRRALANVEWQKPGVYVQMGNYVETLEGNRLPASPMLKYRQGPWEADTITKHVDTWVNPITQVTEVERSGFVVRDPGAAKEWKF